MKRYLAHHIVVDGVRYDKLSVATINDDNTVTVTKFTEEIHSTVYVDGTLVLTTLPVGVKVSIINQ